MDAKQAVQNGLIPCEDADGNIEYLTELAYDIRSRRAEPTAFPIGHNKRTAKPVTAHTPQGEGQEVGDHEHDNPTVATAASIVELLKATTTEAEARAVVGDDQRKTVLKMLDMHLKKLAKQ